VTAIGDRFHLITLPPGNLLAKPINVIMPIQDIIGKSRHELKLHLGAFSCEYLGDFACEKISDG